MFLYDTGNFAYFQYFSFETSFLINAISFQKTRVRFLVQSARMKMQYFHKKTALPEGNVKANGIGSTKLTYHKERRFPSSYFTFSKILFQFKNLV